MKVRYLHKESNPYYRNKCLLFYFVLNTVPRYSGCSFELNIGLLPFVLIVLQPIDVDDDSKFGKVWSGWPHSSQNKISCVFPEFSLCYINFPCVIFTQKLTITSVNKDHITTLLLHTEAYKLIFKMWIV